MPLAQRTLHNCWVRLFGFNRNGFWQCLQERVVLVEFAYMPSLLRCVGGRTVITSRPHYPTRQASSIKAAANQSQSDVEDNMTRKTGIGGHQRGFRGKTDEWVTPPEIIEALGPFDLDPCTPSVQPWPTASARYSPSDEGLSQAWSGRVWLNPPYGPDTGLWLEALANHGNGIALIFARTETEMFHRFVWQRADSLLFLKGRLHFHDIHGRRAKANAGAPSVLIAYGKTNTSALESCGISGHLVYLKEKP